MLKVTFNNETHNVKGMSVEEAWHKVCPPDARFQCPVFIPIDNKKLEYRVVSSLDNLPVGKVVNVQERRTP